MNVVMTAATIRVAAKATATRSTIAVRTVATTLAMARMVALKRTPAFRNAD